MTGPGDFGRRATKRNFVVNRKGDFIFGFHLSDPQTGQRVPFPDGTFGRLEVGGYDDFKTFRITPNSLGSLLWKLESEDTDSFVNGEPCRVYIEYTTTIPTTELFVFKGPVKRDD